MNSSDGVSRLSNGRLVLAGSNVRLVSQLQQRHRPSGSTKDYVVLFARVRPEHRAKAHRMAAALDISLGDLVDQLLQHAQVDENDRPLWADEPAHQELPLAG